MLFIFAVFLFIQWLDSFVIIIALEMLFTEDLLMIRNFYQELI